MSQFRIVLTSIILLTLFSTHVNAACSNANVNIADKMHNAIQNTVAATVPDNPYKGCLSSTTQDFSKIVNPFAGIDVMKLLRDAKNRIIEQACAAARRVQAMPANIVNGVVNNINRTGAGLNGTINNSINGAGNAVGNTIGVTTNGAVNGITGAVNAPVNNVLGTVTNTINQGGVTAKQGTNNILGGLLP